MTSDGTNLSEFDPDPADREAGNVTQVWKWFAQEFGPLEPDDWPITIMFGGSTWDWFEKTGCGRMWSASKPTVYEGEPWGFDNGAWAAWEGEGHSMSPGDFPKRTFLRRLQQVYGDVEPPTVAVVPDLLNAGLDSLHFSCQAVERLQEEGYGEWPWYLPIQKGMNRKAVYDRLELFDGLFLGGGKHLKPQAREWMAVAEEAEVPVHYGQCGTIPKLQHAIQIGVDSLDSAAPVMNFTKLKEFLSTCATYFFEEDAPLADE